MNTVNWLDGRWTAAGVGIIAALLFAWHSYNLGQFDVTRFPIALAGALLGFLPYNFARQKSFRLSWSRGIGYTLATLALITPAKSLPRSW